jgi:N-acetylglucosamine kinase-like BadF-type ATPase
MEYVLGVDGGNTKTIALLAHTDGTIVGAGRGGCGDIYGVGGAEGAFQSIGAAVSGAWQCAGGRALPLRAVSLRAASLRAAAFSLAGADWPEDFVYLRSELAERGIAPQAVVVNDAIGALRAGSRDGTGVSVAVGTGTAIGACNTGGRVWHVSFWLREAHGTGELSHNLLRLLTRAELGIDPPTPLAKLMCEALGESSVEDLLHRVTRRIGADNSGRLLVPVLMSACDSGDATALQLVRDFGHKLGDYVLAAARKVGLVGCDFDMVLTGGVLRGNSQCLIDVITEHVRASAPGARPVRARFEPAVGALLIALESAGVPIDDRLLANLTQTLPSPALFETG